MAVGRSGQLVGGEQALDIPSYRVFSMGLQCNGKARSLVVWPLKMLASYQCRSIWARIVSGNTWPCDYVTKRCDSCRLLGAFSSILADMVNQLRKNGEHNR